jgi:hypothetical protein
MGTWDMGLLDSTLTDERLANAWRELWRALSGVTSGGAWLRGEPLASCIARWYDLDGLTILALLDEAAAEGLAERAYVPGALPSWRRAQYRVHGPYPHRHQPVVLAQVGGSGPHRPDLP